MNAPSRHEMLDSAVYMVLVQLAMQCILIATMLAAFDANR